jgi:hypothetical protein
VTSPPRTGRPLRLLCGVRALVLGVLTVVGLLALGTVAASAAALPDGGNRVGVSASQTITAVGVSEHVSPGQGRDPPVWQGRLVVATGVAAEGVPSVVARADELARALDPIAQTHRTAAVLRTNAGDVLGGGGRDLSPAQRALAGAGDRLATFPQAHAEPTVLREALQQGLTPLELGTSRLICPPCQSIIEEFGGTITGPRTASWLGPQG